ncbi:MAG: archaeal flagellar protein FlaJ [Thermoplasmata archaeon]|nr:archaeal flagellar protein FlaJ [Thermoplasmata archaeon]
MADLPSNLKDNRPTIEHVVLGLMWAAAILAVAGVTAVAALPAEQDQIGRVAEAVGLAAAIAATAVSTRLTTLRHMRAGKSGGRLYDQLRGQRGLQIASLSLQLIEVFAAIVLTIRLLDAVGMVRLDIEPVVVDNGTRFLVAALALACTAALSQSLRTPAVRVRSPQDTVLAFLALSAAGLLALGALLTALGQTGSLDAWIVLHPFDTGPIALAAYVALAFCLVRMRSLPTLTWLMEQRAGSERSSAPGRASAVLIPAVLAFALLLVVFLLFLLFGIGVGDLFLNVGKSPLLLGVLAFLVLALVGALLVAFTLARSGQGDQALYKVLPGAEVRRRRTILIVSGVTAAIFVILAGLAFTGYLAEGLWIHFLCIGLLAGLGPYGFYAAREHNRIRRLEERFPDFLRDIASSHKGGLTLHQAATIAAKGEYGDLTPEVRKMADQLSWNVSFSEALRRFADRVQTPLVQRAVSLILQADRSGGSTTDVLLTAAKDAREIKNLENERRSTMGLYTVVVYITFFVFLGVAAILYAQFAPQIVASSNAVNELGGAGSSGIQGLSGGSIELKQYQMFYFMAALVQGLGDGIVAGLLGTGRAVLGLRHSFLMVAISYVVFAFLL